MKRYSSKMKNAVSHEQCTDALLRDALIRLNHKDADKMEQTPITVEERLFFKDTQAETLRLIRNNTKKFRFSRVNRIAAAVVLCVLLSISVCYAAIPELRSLLSNLVFLKTEHYTSLYLKSTGDVSNHEPVIISPEELALIPIDWLGSYYPTYIPKGFEVNYMSQMSSYVVYQNDVQELLIFEELEGSAGTNLDTERATKTEILLNGQKAILWEKAGEAYIVWAVEDRYFILTLQGEPAEAIRIAESVKKFR